MRHLSHTAVAAPRLIAASPEADRPSRFRAPIILVLAAAAWLILGLALYGLTTALHEAAQLIAPQSVPGVML